MCTLIQYFEYNGDMCTLIQYFEYEWRHVHSNSKYFELMECMCSLIQYFEYEWRHVHSNSVLRINGDMCTLIQYFEYNGDMCTFSTSNIIRVHMYSIYSNTSN